MTDKEQIIINGVDVSKCVHLDRYFLPNCNEEFKDCALSELHYREFEHSCKDNPNCYFKQLQKEKFENLNNRQMVESAENLIYENSELYKNLKEKEQECEELQEKLRELELKNTTLQNRNQ